MIKIKNFLFNFALNSSNLIPLFTLCITKAVMNNNILSKFGMESFDCSVVRKSMNQQTIDKMVACSLKNYLPLASY